MAEQQDDNGPMYSRTAGRDIFGPLDEELPRVRVPGDVLVDARRRAHELGLDLTSFLRLNLYTALYGVEHVTMLHQKLLTRVVGNAPQTTSTAPAEGSPVVALPGFLRAGASR